MNDAKVVPAERTRAYDGNSRSRHPLQSLALHHHLADVGQTLILSTGTDEDYRLRTNFRRMHRRFRMLLVAVFALASTPALIAQRYNFKFYGEEEGLQNLAVQVVLQDREGFLWAGTQNGVFRYDGSHFTGFTKADGLPGAKIESMHESVQGTLWVGTHSGLALRKGDKFETVALGVAKGVEGREGIASDRGGHLYLATERGLVVGTPSGQSQSSGGWTFRLIDAPPGHPADELAASVYVDSTGIVWYGCGLTGLCQLTAGDKGIDTGSSEGLPLEPWEAILEDLEGNLWVRSEHTLAVRLAASHRFQLRAGVPPATNTNPTLALDPAGHLLAPTIQGLARETAHGWELVGAAQGLSTNDIASVQQDREGSIWLGLFGSGLARWLGYNEWQSWNEHEGLSRESVWSLARDTTGRLWAGTQIGLNYAVEKAGRLTWEPQPIPGLEMARALAPGRDGTLWIAGGYKGGLRQWNPRTGAARTFGAADGLTSDWVLHVAVDQGGTVWVATSQGLFRSVSTEPRGTSSANVRFEQLQPAGTQADEGFSMILPDHHGRIWAAGNLGLALYSGGQWTRFTTKDGLKDDMVGQVAEDPDGSVWIGYRDAYGLTHLSFLGNPSGGPAQVEQFTTANGLHSDKTLFLGFDSRGRLWAGTDHGADVHDHMGWRHYGRADGLIWDDCNVHAFLPDTAGAVWIGTSRGLSRFRPSAAPTSGVPPPVRFTSVKVGGKEVDPASMLEVPYGQNTLQVRFAALTFVQESNVMFRYRLANREAWLETPQRELNYPTLSPGPYTLEVIARNAQGVWSTEPARLSFQIMTPWWLSWWFRIASGVMVLFLGSLIWRRRTYRLEAERQRLESAVTQRTRELILEKQRVLEEKARTEHENAVVQKQKQEIERLLAAARQASQFKSEFLANVSHEIRTPMNGILGMTDMVLASEVTPEQREYLETARLSASSLLTLLNDVLDFSKVEAGKLDLSPIPFSLRLCAHQTVKIFSLAAAEKRLHLSVDIGDEVPERLVGDPDRLQQVLINLIGNALKFTERGGVRLVGRCPHPPENGAFTVQFGVHDTGIGIPADKTQLIFEAFRQADGSTTRQFGGTGLGLAICSKLVELMGGRIWVESEPGQGSVFLFTVRFGVAPVEEAHAPVDTPSLRSLLGATLRDKGPEVGATTSARIAPAGLRVLLAEDNPVNQQLERRLLERRGHHVTIAATGRQALECLERESFDIILMDVQMPDMDGLEATEVIRARERDTGIHVPIIALTARTMKEDRDRCLAAGMDAFITKPIQAVEFLTVVESVAVAAQ
jgi:signal transduction histidine kinase/ligand-binding sensor domain-containing protein/CheY-like chemotaxis protein